MARHGLTELGTDCQLRLVASANAAAEGDLGKASRELDAAHRQAAQAAKAPRRPARHAKVPVQSFAAPQGPEAVAASLRARMGQPTVTAVVADAAPAADPVQAMKRRLGVA